VEKPTFLRFLCRSVHWLRLRFFCGFHLKRKLRGYIMMQPDRHFVFTGVFDRAFQNDLVPINFRAEFVFDAVHDVLRRDRSKRFARFAGLQREDKPRLTDSTRQFFCLV
jgi:hypothetical protein